MLDTLPLLCLCLFLAFRITTSFGFFDPAELAPVYGGRIKFLAALRLNSSLSVLLTATASANSLFSLTISYDPSRSLATDLELARTAGHRVVPGLEADNGMGIVAWVGGALNDTCAAVLVEGRLVVADVLGMVSGEDGGSGSVVQNMDDGVGGTLLSREPYLTVGDYLLWTTKEGKMRLGWLQIDRNSTDCWYESASLRFGDMLTGADDDGSPVIMAVSPNDGLLYVILLNQNWLYVSPVPIDDIVSGATVPSPVSPLSLPESVRNAGAFGIGPDGRLFVQGDFGVSFTDDGGNSWTSAGGDVPRQNVGFEVTFGFTTLGRGGAGNYYVYALSKYSANRGETWGTLGSVSKETNPNDGAVAVDLSEERNVLFCTTDAGVGYSLNDGLDVSDLNWRLRAVQINDFEVTTNKSVAWTASKSGIRQAVNFGNVGGTETWYTHWPMFDGSPYFSVGLDPSDGDRVFVGNVRVYFTSNAGSSWSKVWEFLDTEWGFSTLPGGPTVKSIEVWETHPDVVVIGIHVPEDIDPVGTLLYSSNSGSSWDQVTSLTCNVNQLIISKNLTTNGVFVVHLACDKEGIQVVTFSESFGIISSPTVAAEAVAISLEEGGIAYWGLLATGDFQMNGITQDERGNLYGGGAVWQESEKESGKESGKDGKDPKDEEENQLV